MSETDSDAERQKAFSLKYIEQSHAEAMFAKQTVATFAQSAVRLLFLINGGAVIALLTFLGALYGKEGRALQVAQTLSKSLPDPMALYLLGLGLAVATAGWSYLNFSIMESTTRTPGELLAWSRHVPMKEVPKLSLRALMGSAWAAFAFGLASLGCFGWGAWLTLSAFRAAANL